MCSSAGFFAQMAGKSSFSFFCLLHLSRRSFTSSIRSMTIKGIDRTTELVRQRCFWPGMSADIKDWVQKCERCQVAKDSGQVPHSFMGHLLASQPNELLALDFTLLQPSQNGFENVLVLTDVFSLQSLSQLRTNGHQL